MSTDVIRVAHLVSHPIQYFVPLYRELARRPEIELTVFFFSDRTLGTFHDSEFGREIRWDIDLHDGYRSCFLPSSHDAPTGYGVRRRLNRDVLRALSRREYDVVWAHGYMHPTVWGARAVAAVCGVPFLLREEQTLLRSRGRARQAFKYPLLRLLLAGTTGLFIGRSNRAFLEHYGVRGDRLFFAPYCVDNNFFRAAAAQLNGRKEVLRREFGLDPAKPVVLFAGKLSEMKRPLMLLRAFAEVSAELPCSLLFAGDGALRASIEREIAEANLRDVVLTGFLNQTEIGRAYGAADLLVLPSIGRETWGLVVNEAMNFRLPVVVSDQVGCAQDLVHDGVNGYVVPSDDERSLAEALRTLVRDSDLRARFGEASFAIVEEYGIDRCADGIVSACLAATREADQVPGRQRAVEGS